MGSYFGVAAALKVIAQVPAATSTILYAHIAQHGVEVEHRHIEGLGHLGSREGILGRFVEHMDCATYDSISTIDNLLGRQLTALCIFGWYVTASLADLWQNLRGYPTFKGLGLRELG